MLNVDVHKCHIWELRFFFSFHVWRIFFLYLTKKKFKYKFMEIFNVFFVCFQTNKKITNILILENSSFFLLAMDEHKPSFFMGWCFRCCCCCCKHKCLMVFYPQKKQQRFFFCGFYSSFFLITHIQLNRNKTAAVKNDFVSCGQCAINSIAG